MGPRLGLGNILSLVTLLLEVAEISLNHVSEIPYIIPSGWFSGSLWGNVSFLYKLSDALGSS